MSVPTLLVTLLNGVMTRLKDRDGLALASFRDRFPPRLIITADARGGADNLDLAAYA